MRAIILAAGRGSRLFPLTEDCPKCLTQLGERTLVENQISTFRKLGIDDIVLISGYRAEMLAFLDVQQVTNEAWATTNMVESLFCAESYFGDDFIISYGDIVFDGQVLEALLKSPHDISVVIDNGWREYWEQRFEDPLEDAETLKLDNAGRITEIGNKPTDIAEIAAQYIGLMRFKGAGVGLLTDAYKEMGKEERPWMESRPLRQAYMTDLLMELIHRGDELYGIPVNRGWFEIDTVHDLEVARSYQ